MPQAPPSSTRTRCSQILRAARELLFGRFLVHQNCVAEQVMGDNGQLFLRPLAVGPIPILDGQPRVFRWRSRAVGYIRFSERVALADGHLLWQSTLTDTRTGHVERNFA